jgi:hypothetical protein
VSVIGGTELAVGTDEKMLLPLVTVTVLASLFLVVGSV